MLSIFDLPIDKFNRLTNLEPMLDKDWKIDLMDIMSSLDKESQQSIYQSVIKPKGILYNPKTKQLTAMSPLSFADAMKKTHFDNDLFVEAAVSLQELLTPPPTIPLMPLHSYKN